MKYYKIKLITGLTDSQWTLIKNWTAKHTSWDIKNENSFLVIEAIKELDPDDWIDFVNYITNENIQVLLQEQNFPVLNMTCASCAASTQSVLQDQLGVFSAQVNYASQQSVITYSSSITNPEKLKLALQAVGYDLLIEDPVVAKQKQKELKIKAYKILKNKVIGAIILAIPLLIIGMLHRNGIYDNLIMLVLATPLVFYFGKDFFIRAYKQAIHKKANMDTLVALSTGVAYLYSLAVMMFPNFWHQYGIHPHVYFESAGIVIAFVLLGKFLEERAKIQTFKSLEKLMGLQVKTLWVIRNNLELEIEINEVLIGDVVVVKPGNKVPVDGVILEGSSYVDESMITGEPLAVAKQINDFVYAGTINQKGSFRFRADKIGSQTLLAQIIQKVEEAQNSKAPIQNIVDKISEIFVPIVVTIAIVSFVCWFLFANQNGFVLGINAFVTVLVIACPCALGLATPTAIMVGMGKAAEKGILIQDAESLERAQHINLVVLDKTGTITKGEPAVQAYFGLNEKAIEILYSIEKQSEHPLADAVVKFFKDESRYIDGISVENIVGQGIGANFAQDFYWVGNLVLMQQKQMQISTEISQWILSRKPYAETIIYFAKNKEVLGVLAIADAVKASSKSAINHLQKMNIEVVMLTGDQFEAAQAIANQVGIISFKAGVLPDEKALFIKEQQAKGKIVAMVGDGVNDTNALAQADVSLAMGKGSDVAMDVAQMTIVSSDLEKIPQAIAISKQTRNTIKQNLFWAFIYNIIGIPIAAGVLYNFDGFLLNPMWASAAMALSSVSVVANSLRLKLK
jgi:P-type Cu2+ transporter